MSRQPALTISIVSYNCRAALSACLDSLAVQQDAPAFEVIVIDNASADDTVKYLRQHYPDIHLIANTENVGFGRAHNQAAKLARGEWFFILNPDTELPTSTLAELYVSREQADLIAPQLRHGDGRLQRSAHRHWPSWWSHTYLYNFYIFVLWQRLFHDYDPTLYSPADHAYELHPLHVMGAAMFVKAEIYAELGGFDEDFFLYLEETDFCYRLRAAGHSLIYMPSITITHQLGVSIKAGALGQGSPHFLRSSYLYRSKHMSPTMLGLLYRWTVLTLRCNLVTLGLLHKLMPAQAKIALGLDFSRQTLAWHYDHRKEVLS